ncbi:hypothetical protein JL720_16956 [Aureococcus anophagefferens]|nr:hypothetical protein JL720_16956 [Aureococcus anophagefferens]
MGKKEKQEIESLKSRNGDLEKKMAKDRNEAEKRLKEEKDNAEAALADWRATAEEEKAEAADGALRAKARDAAAGLGETIARLGAALAHAGELGDAERLYHEGAHLRGDVFGARHAEEAETLRVMANHCRERNDLQAALAYMERSCSAYTSSLRSGESAAALRCADGAEAARATPLATLAAPAHATQPAPPGPTTPSCRTRCPRG